MTPEKIRELRDRAELTQRELANILEVNRSAVAQWESGVNRPSRIQAEMLKALRRELDHRDKAEWRNFLAKAGGALSLAYFLSWLKDE